MKIIPFYLPQFHEIPENNLWWGEGFTEWVNVRKAVPMFAGHRAPRVPLNNYYYDLSKKETIKWQWNLAKKYGIYGFCFYHYWFDGKLLLEKPAEMWLEDKTIDMPLCFCWPNEDWTNSWAGGDKKVLIQETYNDKAIWKQHFEYLYPFFADERYIKEDNCPLFIIYRPELMKHGEEILSLWDSMAKERGMRGIKFAYQQNSFPIGNEQLRKYFDYGVEYQPAYAFADYEKQQSKIVSILRALVLKSILSKIKSVRKKAIKQYDYQKLWSCILQRLPVDSKMIPGAFVDWDNTPRHGIFGSLCKNVSPGIFQKNMECLIKRTREIYHKDKIFLFAWNEWGEGGYWNRMRNFNMDI